MWKAFMLVFEALISSALLVWVLKHPQVINTFGDVTTGGVLDSVHALQGQ